MLYRRSLLAAALGLALAAAARAALAPSRVEVLDFDWFDAARSRAVPVRLYLPADASGPQPLVLFSHGIGGSRMGYQYLGRHWAANGVASLHVQHVGSDRGVWMGNPFDIVSRLQGAATDTEALARVHDLRFALDTLLTGPLADRIDARRVAAAGHSYGANTALLAVGARVRRDGRVLALRDARLAGAVIISAPPFYGERDMAQVLAPIEVPTLHVTATEDVIRIPGYYSGSADRIAVYDAVGSPRKWLAVFKGGSHSMFTDRGGTGGATLNPQVKAATQALSQAFLATLLQGGDDAALRAWPQRFADIVERFATR